MLDAGLKGSNLVAVSTFDSGKHEFHLIKDDTKYCFKYDGSPKLISKLVIKPDLWVLFRDGGYEQGINFLSRENNCKRVLASGFDIDPDIFELLVTYDLISYSKGMADLYDLPIIHSRDFLNHCNDYKRSKNKDLVLEKMRNGIFN